MLEQPPHYILTPVHIYWYKSTLGCDRPQFSLVKNRPYPCCVRHALLSALPSTLERQVSPCSCPLLYIIHCKQCKWLSHSPHHISGQAYHSALSHMKCNRPLIKIQDISNSRQNKSYLLKLFSKQ